MVTSPLLINESPLQVLPSLAKSIGLNEAIILQQIHYWLNPKHNKNIFDGQHWVWNTYEQWQQQFPFWGNKTIRRAIANLEEAGLLKSFITRDFKKVKYYTIDYTKLSKLADSSSSELLENIGFCPSGQNDQVDLPKWADRESQNDQIDQVKSTRSYIDTEITSENTLHHSADNEEKCKEMISIWNTIIQEKLHPGTLVCLTPKRIKYLSTFLEKILDNKITWEDFCIKIAKSKFLMGSSPSGFKVSLDWALKKDNAYKILEGAIYDPPSKEVYIEGSWEEIVEKIKDHLPQGPYIEEWLSICKVLVKFLGYRAFKSWFLCTGLIKLTKNTATIHVESEFKKTYISSHFYSDIKLAICTIYPAVGRIEFQVANKAHILPEVPFDSS